LKFRKKKRKRKRKGKKKTDLIGERLFLKFFLGVPLLPGLNL